VNGYAWNSTLRPGKPLQRRKGLEPSAGLARSAGLSRGTPLRPRSAKTERIYVTRRQIVAEMFLYPSVCEVTAGEGVRNCTAIATDPHEPLTRARGGDILDPGNIRKVCHYHNWLFGQREEPWMYQQGFLVHSWDGITGGEAA
jgi:hypothetical protein